MKLVVVRHLPTAWNADDRLQGRKDIPIAPLDDAARARLAKQAAQLRALEPFDAVFCSTMSRTRQTAALFGYDQLAAEPLLDELDFGEFEGRLRGEMLAKVGRAWLDAPHTLTFGESVLALGERVREFARRNLKRSRVLAFGHGGWTRALCSLQRTGGLQQMNQLTIANGEAITFDLQPDAAFLSSV
jgi:probable phosphoglycerate mutase